MSNTAPGLETLSFDLPGKRAVAPFAPILVGVVGSGNLEILVEPSTQPGCRIALETSARGFGAIWQAVFDDFQSRHELSGVSISIHDMGATPAVVSLRLEQAIQELTP